MKYLLLLCMPIFACEKIQRSPGYSSLVNMVPVDTYKTAANLLSVERETIVRLSFKKVENHHLIEDLVYSWDREVLEAARRKLEDQLEKVD